MLWLAYPACLNLMERDDCEADAHCRRHKAAAEQDCQMRREVDGYLILLHASHRLCTSHALFIHYINFQIHLSHRTQFTGLGKGAS